jgi:hypothetical protein
MSKRIVGLLAAVFVFALVAHASDPWKDKDFTQWDQKDVQRILRDSPWSKQFQFGLNAGSAGGAPISSTGEAAHAGGGDMGGGAGGGGGSGLSANGGIDRSSGSLGREINFSVSWISSRTVREARARARELQGTSAEEARKDLSVQSDTYMIAVLGSDLSSFGKETNDTLKTHTYLMSKSTKEKLSPSKVVINQSQESRRPLAIIFEFPKKTESGTPTIATGEKNLEFGTAAGTTPIKVTFDLTKMVDKQGPDM